MRSSLKLSKSTKGVVELLPSGVLATVLPPGVLA